MISITIKLFPERMDNPDLDIRYVLPDLIATRSGNAVKGKGYDYGEGDDIEMPPLLLFLGAEREEYLRYVMDVVTGDEVLGNNLVLAAEVYVELEGQSTRVFPA